MADVGKSTLVNIDGEHQLHDIMCSWVFGGNDISGSIGSDMDGTESPRIATADIDNTFHTHVYTTKERISEDPSAPYHIYVGQMFGGGNGDYTFESVSDSEDPDYGKYRIIRGHDKTVVGTIPASMLPAGATSLPKPEVARSYVNVGGGIYGYVFNGGNNATITDKAVISINNESAITSKCTLPTGQAFDLDDYTRRESLNMNSVNNPIDLRLIKMGLNLSTFETGNHFLRVFGGNNQADMSIIPTWDLRAGKIRDLYSGGNKGDMTNYAGILLEIPKTSAIEVTNAYGGCCMANVRPMRNGVEELTVSSYDLNMALGLPENTYRFPDHLSARILVRGGRIHNVYGGNDITGIVFGAASLLSKSLIAVHPLLKEIPHFACAMICGALLNFIMKKLHMSHYFDRATINRISGVALDYLVCAAVATLSLKVFSLYLVPLVSVIGVTIVANLIANFYFSWKIFDVDWFERAVASYGLESGVLATGLMLLRVVDPKFETTGQESVASAVSLLYPLAIPNVILMPMLSTKVNGWVLFAISAAIWAGFYIVARRCFWHSERKFTDILSSKCDAPRAQRS